MKRIHLFEFEDQKWFPDSIRTYMTGLLSVLHRMVGTKEVISGLIRPLIREQKIRRIVDLGSGSAGIMPAVFREVNDEGTSENVELLLTDLYPNKEQIAKWRGTEGISYQEEPLDATDWRHMPHGLKTMINCFHHMKPKQARKILNEAFQKKEPLLIYEMGENNIPLLLWWILLPLSLVVLVIMALFMTPMVKPLSWQQLLFTYIIPVVPLCYAWDGQVSIVRMYTMNDLDELLAGLDSETYKWEKGKAYKQNGKQLGTFLMGIPGNI